MRFFRHFCREATTPLLILVVIAVLYVGAAAHALPTPSELAALLAIRLSRGERTFVFGCAILESTVGVNGYFPGAFVILYAMANAHGYPAAAIRMFWAICAGSLLGQLCSYGAGRGLAPPTTERGSFNQLVARGFGSYWHPQLGSAYSFSAGRQRIAVARFGLVLALTWFPWNVFWGMLMYHVGAVPMRPGGFIGIFAIYLMGWLVLAAFKTARLLAAQEQR